MNNSATAGYIQPQATTALPRNLTFTQFLQVALVGISGFPGELVRPEWQVKPPKQPDIETDWLAFGVHESGPSAGFPYLARVQTNPDDPTSVVYQSQKHERVTLTCSMYGPAALENYRLLRDGFYIPQNNESLVTAGFGLVGVSKALRMPELIDERWFNKWVFTIDLYFEQIRTYPILTFVSASGTAFIPVAKNADFSVDWLVTQ